MWIDFRGIRDAFMREHGIDYFENSRQATYVQQEYAIRNPMEFEGYGEHCWGFTACDGPGWIKRVVNGVEREFFDYIARGAPFGPDDGTIAPWVVVASLPFAPEIVLPTIRHFARMDLGMTRPYGFKPSFNQTFAVEDSPTGWWVSPYHFGIDQGPVVLMIENYRTRFALGPHAPLSADSWPACAGRASPAAGCDWRRGGLECQPAVPPARPSQDVTGQRAEVGHHVTVGQNGPAQATVVAHQRRAEALPLEQRRHRVEIKQPRAQHVERGLRVVPQARSSSRRRLAVVGGRATQRGELRQCATGRHTAPDRWRVLRAGSGTHLARASRRGRPRATRRGGTDP